MTNQAVTRRLFYYFTLLLWVFLGCSLATQAMAGSRLDEILGKQQPEFLPVEQAFMISTNQYADHVEVMFEIADGYYLYRDKLHFTLDGGTVEQPSFPTAEAHEDEFFGTTYVYRQQVTLEVPYSLNRADAELTVHYMGCADAGLCYPPSTLVVPLDSAQAIANPGSSETHTPGATTAPTEKSASSLATRLAGSDISLTLGVFFILGLGLALTPCVFPMYPILAAAIAGSDGQRPGWFRSLLLAMSYIQGMALTYTLLGLVVASLGVQFQAWFQHPFILIGLSVLFTLLAISMFSSRLFQLPGRWQNMLNTCSQRFSGGRIIPVFILGIIAGLVASPCTTAPLTGALLYVAQSGDQLLGALALYLLSLGMGVPLLIIGVLGQRLLPKSGPWMETVKHLFGFILLIVPLLLLDRLWPANITFISWGLLLLLTGAYLLQAVRTSHNRGIATVVIAIAFALLYSGASLLWQQAGWLSSTQSMSGTVQQEPTFITVHSVDEVSAELTKARAAGKPVVLDFFAQWCVACKEFDAITFNDTAVQQHLSSMVLLRADVTDNSASDVALLKRFQVLGLPSILFFDDTGNELTQQRVAGFLEPEAFVHHLRQTYTALN